MMRGNRRIDQIAAQPPQSGKVSIPIRSGEPGLAYGVILPTRETSATVGVTKPLRVFIPL
jgi:hypothetical protein